MTCKAYQVSDQMMCDQCSLVWDMNTDDRPECSPTILGVLKEKRKELLKPDQQFICATDGERLIGFDMAYTEIVRYITDRSKEVLR